ncbi:Hypothetical predicted protein [Podarcis lilfordi]|uniref:Uncharacterized protein n=1 Tax=Podarcis lilfordi TaxID=74358 RepID=A0AA35KHH5_9SAUR|nr:Hypothetical predicted protein [Podarcis lilfordi]
MLTHCLMPQIRISGRRGKRIFQELFPAEKNNGFQRLLSLYFNERATEKVPLGDQKIVLAIVGQGMQWVKKVGYWAFEESLSKASSCVSTLPPVNLCNLGLIHTSFSPVISSHGSKRFFFCPTASFTRKTCLVLNWNKCLSTENPIDGIYRFSSKQRVFPGKAVEPIPILCLEITGQTQVWMTPTLRV